MIVRNIYLMVYVLIIIFNVIHGVTEHTILHPFPKKLPCRHKSNAECPSPGSYMEEFMQKHCYECSGEVYCVADHITNQTYYICASKDEMTCDAGYFGRFTLVDNKIQFEKVTCPSGTYLLFQRDCRGRICKPYDWIDTTEYKLETRQKFDGEPALVSCAQGLCPEPYIEQPFKYRAAVCKSCSNQTNMASAVYREISTSTPAPTTMAADTTPTPSNTPKAAPQTLQLETTTIPNISAKPDPQNDANILVWPWVVGVIILILLLVGMWKRKWLKNNLWDKFFNKDRRILEKDLKKTKEGSSSRLIENPGMEKASNGSTSQKNININVYNGASLTYCDGNGKVNVHTRSVTTSLTTPENGDLVAFSTLASNEEDCMDGEEELIEPTVTNGDTTAIDKPPVQASDAEVIATQNTSQATGAADDCIIQVEVHNSARNSSPVASQTDSVQTDGIQTNDDASEGEREQTLAKTLYDDARSDQSTTETDETESETDETEHSRLLHEEEAINFGRTDPGRSIPVSSGHGPCGNNMLDATARYIRIKA